MLGEVKKLEQEGEDLVSKAEKMPLSAKVALGILVVAALAVVVQLLVL